MTVQVDIPVIFGSFHSLATVFILRRFIGGICVFSKTVLFTNHLACGVQVNSLY